MTAPRRFTALFVAAPLCMATALFATRAARHEAPAATIAPPLAAAGAADSARSHEDARGFGVIAIEGVAERHHGDRHVPLAVGDVIPRTDWVTTGKSSSLRLGKKGGATLQVSSSTRVRVDEADGGNTRVTLDRGRVRATSPAGSSIGMRAADGRAAVESVGGDFTMQAEPGVVRVVPHRNQVTLIARDERIVVQPGDGVVVAGSRAPVKSKVPNSLLLKVRWPEGLAQRERRMLVQGETAPGSVVRSGGSEVVADASGRFTITVALHEGENRPHLTSEDVAGHHAASTGDPVLVDSHRPAIAHEGLRYGE